VLVVVFRASKWEWPIDRLEALDRGDVDLTEAITDPDQAMVVAKQCLSTPLIPRLQLRAADVFERAGVLGGNEYRWRAAEDLMVALHETTSYVDSWRGAFTRAVAWWGHAVGCEFAPGGWVTCDPRVFAPADGDGMVEGRTMRLGVTPAARDVVAAFERACRRFALINELGEEFDDEDDAHDGVLYAVNAVLGPRVADGVAWVAMDNQSQVLPLMAGAMLHALHEELTRTTTPGIHIIPPPDE
jgi:hypothetical protein